MWLLLVAAGSGYLARCWHRTLRTKPQLTDYAHVDTTVTRDEQPSAQSLSREEQPSANSSSREEQPSAKSSSEAGSEEPIANAPLKSFTATLGPELAPKHVKRTFSPKAISKKLFSSESSKGKQVAKREAKARSFTGSASVVDPGAEKSSTSAPVRHGKRSPWSSFKSKRTHSSQGAVRVEEDSGDLSTGNLKPPSESSSARKTGNYGSSSSRSLQDSFGELDSASSMLSSPGQSGRSLPGTFVDTEVVETCEDSQSGNLQDVTRCLFRPNAERLKVQESPGSSSRISVENLEENAPDTGDSSSRREVPTSVADAIAQIEKGNLSSKVESVSVTSSHSPGRRSRTRGIVREKVQTLNSESKEQISGEEADSTGGGKGKRRADAASKVTMLGSKVALSSAVLTGKRIKDSNKDQSSNGTGESAEVTLASITGKRTKDGDKAKENFEEDKKLSPSIAGGIVDLSQVFFGFDNTFLGSTAEEKSPIKFLKKSKYTVRAGAKPNVRKMRESPRPVSALESCLQAQFPDREENSRVARALNFSALTSSSVSRQDNLEPSLDEPYPDGESLSAKMMDDETRHDGTDQDSPKSEGALGLPLLKAIPSTSSVLRATSDSSGSRLPEPRYPRPIVLEERGRIVSSKSKVNDVLWRRTTLPVAPKKRKVSQACSTAATSSTNMKPKGYELEALVIPPMEGLLFSFGVGIGVMSLIGESDKEVERLSRELEKSEKEIKILNEELKAARDGTLEAANAQLSKQVMVVGSLAVEKVTAEVGGSSELLLNRVGIIQSTEDVGTDSFDLVRKEAPETPQQTEHMAELEAELEAELDALTGGISDGLNGLLDFDELDPEGFAGLANRDLGVEGLPALLDWDDDNDDFITEEHTQSGGVPPRELRRLLRKVQSSREELRIADLEMDLQESVEKLQTLEKELQLLRETMKAVQSPSVESVQTDFRDFSDALNTERTDSVHDSTSSPQSRKGEGVSFEEEESARRDRRAVGSRAIVIPSIFEDPETLNDEPIVSFSPKRESAAGLRASVARKLGSSPLRSEASKEDFSLRRAASVELGATLRRLSSMELGSSFSESPLGRFSDATRPAPSDLALLRGSTSSSTLKEPALAIPVGADKHGHSEAHNDNDAVCDEFLSSVFGSSEEEDNRSLGSSVVSHPAIPTLPKTFSLNDDFLSGEEEKSSAVVNPQDVLRMVRAKSTEEDLDQVVDKLLKRDTSSVKNAINAFLQWEAEDEKQEKESQPGSAEGTSPLFLRRTAGKYTTPQKTVSSSSSPLRTAVLTSRLEELAKTTASTNERTYPDKIGFSPRKGGHGKTKKVVDEDLEVFQPPEPHPEDRSARTPGRRDYQVTKKDRSPRPREGRKSMTENRRELYRTESPVFGSVDVDFDSLLDMRRERRYSSAKVELSSSGPPRERDVIPSGYRPREDSSRAGTNSPTERQSSVKLLYSSPKPRSSRPVMDRRLYHNLTSDWYAEVGSPPIDKS